MAVAPARRPPHARAARGRGARHDRRRGARARLHAVGGLPAARGAGARGRRRAARPPRRPGGAHRGRAAARGPHGGDPRRARGGDAPSCAAAAATSRATCTSPRSRAPSARCSRPRSPRSRARHRDVARPHDRARAGGVACPRCGTGDVDLAVAHEDVRAAGRARTRGSSAIDLLEDPLLRRAAAATRRSPDEPSRSRPCARSDVGRDAAGHRLPRDARRACRAAGFTPDVPVPRERLRRARRVRRRGPRRRARARRWRSAASATASRCGRSRTSPVRRRIYVAARRGTLARPALGALIEALAGGGASATLSGGWSESGAASSSSCSPPAGRRRDEARGRRGGRRRGRSPGIAGCVELRSPPNTSGAPPAHSSAVAAASSEVGPALLGRVRRGVQVDHPAAGLEPDAVHRAPLRPPRQLARRGGRRSGPRRADEDRVAAAAVGGEQVRVAARRSRGAREPEVPRGAAPSGRSRRAARPSSGGHHGGTSWSSATSHSQPASVARTPRAAAARPRAPRGRGRGSRSRTRMPAEPCARARYTRRLPRHFLTGAELTPAELAALLDRARRAQGGAARLRRARRAGASRCCSSMPSTRTRTSFEAGIVELGGHPMVLRPGELQLARGESVRDTALVLSRHVAAIGLRTGLGGDAGRARRAGRDVPVVNMLSPEPPSRARRSPTC